MPTRREFNGLLGASIALFGAAPLLGARAFAQDAATDLRVATVPVIDAAAFYAAEQNGLFQERKLGIDPVPTHGGSIGVTGLAAGEFQIAQSNVVSLILAASQGHDFKIVVAHSSVGTAPPNDISCIAVKKGLGIKSAKDLEGRRIAVNTLNNINWLAVRLWMDKHGGDSSKAQFVEVPFPQQVDALASGRVDAASLNEPFISAALETRSDAIEIMSWTFSELFPNSVISTYLARDEFIQAHEKAIHDFADAYGQGVEWVNSHKGTPELETLISSFTKLPPERIRGLQGWPRFEGKVDPSDLDRMMEAMVRYGLIETPLEATDLLYETALS